MPTYDYSVEVKFDLSSISGQAGTQFAISNPHFTNALRGHVWSDDGGTHGLQIMLATSPTPVVVDTSLGTWHTLGILNNGWVMRVDQNGQSVKYYKLDLYLDGVYVGEGLSNWGPFENPSQYTFYWDWYAGAAVSFEGTWSLRNSQLPKSALTDTFDATDVGTAGPSWNRWIVPVVTLVSTTQFTAYANYSGSQPGTGNYQKWVSVEADFPDTPPQPPPSPEHHELKLWHETPVDRVHAAWGRWDQVRLIVADYGHFGSRQEMALAAGTTMIPTGVFEQRGRIHAGYHNYDTGRVSWLATVSKPVPSNRAFSILKLPDSWEGYYFRALQRLKTGGCFAVLAGGPTGISLYCAVSSDGSTPGKWSAPINIGAVLNPFDPSWGVYADPQPVKTIEWPDGSLSIFWSTLARGGLVIWHGTRIGTGFGMGIRKTVWNPGTWANMPMMLDVIRLQGGQVLGLFGGYTAANGTYWLAIGKPNTSPVYLCSSWTVPAYTIKAGLTARCLSGALVEWKNGTLGCIYGLYTDNTLHYASSKNCGRTWTIEA